MSRKIYVGNLNYATLEESLRELFSSFGRVESVQMGIDPLSGAPRGFAFVEMGSEENAEQAIRALNGKDFEGRALRVNAAQERRSRA